MSGDAGSGRHSRHGLNVIVGVPEITLLIRIRVELSGEELWGY